MAKKLFIGNINGEASDKDLENLFAEYGTIEEAVIITDRATGRSRGFGFVTFSADEEAAAAAKALNGTDFMGRELVVNEARTREE